MSLQMFIALAITVLYFTAFGIYFGQMLSTLKRIEQLLRDIQHEMDCPDDEDEPA